MKPITSYLLLFSLFVISRAKVDYTKYLVLRILPEDTKALNILNGLKNLNLDVSYWIEPTKVGHAVDLMVSPEHKDKLEGFLNSYKIKSDVYIHNVQELIENEKEGFGLNRPFGWHNYYTLEEINDWLESLPSKFSEAKVITAGKTYQGRDIKGVHVSFSQNNSNNAIFIEANIHAREWVSGAVATFILNEVLTSKDPTFRQFADRYDWYIVPIANPDGFVYTHTENRLWRKTMKPYGGPCFGADPNRNWDAHWGTVGVSHFPCADIYCGSSAFSEVETKSLSEYLSSLKDKLVGYIDFHAYSQLLMVPYGHTSEHLDNYNITYPLGLHGAAALEKRFGTKYKVGSIYEAVYPASGGSIDWVKANLKTPLAYCYELRDTGKYGFLLPPSQIIPSAQEVIDSLVVIFDEYEKLKTSS